MADNPTKWHRPSAVSRVRRDPSSQAVRETARFPQRYADARLQTQDALKTH